MPGKHSTPMALKRRLAQSLATWWAFSMRGLLSHVKQKDWIAGPAEKQDGGAEGHRGQERKKASRRWAGLVFQAPWGAGSTEARTSPQKRGVISSLRVLYTLKYRLWPWEERAGRD